MEENCKEEKEPLLLITHGVEFEKQSFYNVSSKQFETTSIPILSNKLIAASTHGWLVLFDMRNDDCCVWNPITWETIQLPALEDKLTYDCCILTKPPTEPDCRILLKHRKGQKQVHCKIGDEAYVCHTMDDKLFVMGWFHGIIYGVVGERHSLVRIDFVGENMEVTPIFDLGNLDNYSRPWYNDRVCYDYLVEGDEALFLVRRVVPVKKPVHSREFRIFEIRPDRMECVEVEDIGGRSMFVGEMGYGFCCSSASASGSLKSNSVYYTQGKVCKGRSIYIYSLDDVF